jgi:ribosomal protein L39E
LQIVGKLLSSSVCSPLQSGFHRVTPVVVQEVNISKEGILSLAKLSAWPHVVRYSTSILQQNADGALPLTQDELNFILLTRFEALFRLKVYDDLASEINIALNNIINALPNHQIDYHSYSLVDFIYSIRLLLAEVHLLSGQGEMAIKELDAIQLSLEEKKSENERIQYWIWQCEMHRINYNVRSRNWKNALTLQRKLNLEINILLNDDQFSGNDDQLDLIAAKIMLLCRTARLLLQVFNFSFLLNSKIAVYIYFCAVSLDRSK